MVTRGAKAVLSRMNLKYEAVGVVVANNCQGIIKIDDFAQLNEKSVESIYQVIRRTGDNTGCVCPILGLQCQRWMRRTYKE